MKTTKSVGWFLGIVMGGAMSVLAANCGVAQITPDRTLPNNSSVTINGNTFNITGGTQAGRNLFHSFQQFSVPTGSTASFNNGLDIQNIFSRVTGGSASSIDGIIKASGTANVFILNPSGILFGKNASLNIGGSFVATTANAIQFGHLGTFSASVPNNPTLLTINPSALLYNQIAADAAIKNSSVAPAGVAPTGLNSLGLRVPDGKSLILVGGNISMDGGQVNAYGGRVELGGLAEIGTVEINTDSNNLNLRFPDGVARANVSLTNGADVNLKADGGGSITINAHNVDILGQSHLQTGIGKGLGNIGSRAGDIIVNATGAVTISGADNGIYNLVESGALGKGGDIAITADSLVLADGAVLDASTAGYGDSGKVAIKAKGTVFLIGLSTIFNVVDPSGVGNSGGITVDAVTLLMTDGAEFQASTSGKGNAGNVTIQAREKVSFDGVGSDGNSSGIFSTVKDTGEGKAGNIRITSGSLSLTNGAEVLSNTRGLGNGGSITIQANDSLFIDGTGTNGEASGIYTTVGAGVGNGGDIQIKTGLISLTNGGVVNATTYAQGNAGNIVVDASHAILINGLGDTGFPSRILSGVDSPSVGKGGDITLTTGNLKITNGAEVNATSLGQGNAGNIRINARLVELNNQAIINAQTALGNGGNITLQLQDLLLLRRNSRISTNAGIIQAGGDGGNITINTPNGFIVALPNENSDITANAFQGSGGKVIINATDIFGLKSRSRQELEQLLQTTDPTQLDPNQLLTSDITAISQTNPSLNGQVNINTPDTDPSKGLQELPIDIVDVSRLINQNLCVASQGSEFIVTGRGGLPPSPYEVLNAETTWEDWQISPESHTKLTPTTPHSSDKKHQEATKMIAAQGWVTDANGNIILTAKPVTVTPQGSWLHPHDCHTNS